MVQRLWRSRSNDIIAIRVCVEDQQDYSPVTISSAECEYTSAEWESLSAMCCDQQS